MRIHRQTQARPLDRHAEEQPFLLPLPERPFDASEVVYRTVDAQGDVVYRQNFYSVPWRLIGQTLAVRIGETSPDDLRPVVRPAGDSSVVPTRGRRASAAISRSTTCPAMRNSDRSSWPAGLPSSVPPAHGSWKVCWPGSRYGRNQAERVLTLAAAYPRGDVIAALERAVQYGAFSLGAIQRILAARSQPKTPLDLLIDDHRTYLESLLEMEPTPPRPTSDYQALLGQGPDDGEPPDHPAKANRPAPDPCGDDRDVTSVIGKRTVLPVVSGRRPDTERPDGRSVPGARSRP